MASETDQFANLFCGKWVYLRDENFVECMKHMNYPDQVVDFIAGTKPKMNIQREGDTFDMTYELVPGKKMNYEFKLGKEVIVKDDNDPPMYNNKETFTMENGEGKVVTISQLEGPLKIDTESRLVRKGDELHSLTQKLGDNSVVGIRVMVKDK